MTFFTQMINGTLLGMLLAGSVAAQQKQESPRLSPQTKIYLYETAQPGYTGAPLPGYIYRNGYMPALIKVTPAVDAAALEQLGVRTGTRAGNIWTVQVPVQYVKAFTEVKGIEYVQLDEPVYPLMDSVRKVTRVDSVHQGAGLNMPLHGEGVLLGIIDGGFDYTHPAFMDATGSRFRIKKVWEEETVGNPPTGFTYGHEMIDSNTIRAKRWDSTRVLSHGTHVGGIAGGSGYGTPNGNASLRGLAYESDLVFVGIASKPGSAITTGLTHMVDAINYVFTQGAAEGKPVSANLSWGINSGPHDGSSLFSQAVNNLTGPGKILSISAGNEGLQNLHLQKTFTATDTLVHTFISFAQGSDSNTVDMWGEPGKPFCAGFSLYDASYNEVSNTGLICLDDQVHGTYLLGSAGDTCWITMTTSTAEFNQKTRIYVKVKNKTANRLVLNVSGHQGTVHMWNNEGFASNGRSWAANGNTASTISDMATAATAISVGAYSSKLAYTNLNGDPIAYGGVKGAIAYFSSRGPAVDGTVQPFISAPGHVVASAVSSFDSTFLPTGSMYGSAVSSFTDAASGKDYLYGAFSGTSMSSPVVAGVVALMLQMNPTLDPAQIKSILKETAIKDIFTGTIPAAGSNTWGFGKINAYGAIKKLAGPMTGVNSPKKNPLDCFLFPNPGHGEFTLVYQAVRTVPLEVTVYTSLGSKVYERTFETQEGDNLLPVDLRNQQPGIYLLRARSEKRDFVIKVQVL
jgi:subtilisin family serine protease